MSLDALPDYPIRKDLATISERLAQGHLVLSAPPGSGKTTLVPLALLHADWLRGQRIIMLEPRRPAARMAARRMAELLNQAVGESVGYQVRFERKISAATRIEVLTEGLLLKRLQQDPELQGIGLIIFDEFHERSLVADLSLALCRDCTDGLREDLRLLLMSASMDNAALAEKLAADLLITAGRQHPVDIIHQAARAPQAPTTPHWQRLVEQALQQQSGDVLVFLPGKGEIERLREALQHLPDIQLQVLHGELSPAQQDAVIRPEQKTQQATNKSQRRVILSTDIAETSLTIEGIGAVVDSGLNRKPVFDPNNGLTRLQTQPISQASALQRAGRAGRLGPGLCFRAWSEADHARRPAAIQPEILQADLAPLVLEAAAWGVTERTGLQWISEPPEANWAQASELLQQLDALQSNGQLSQDGRCLLPLPTHPRLGHMLCKARSTLEQQQASWLAALLSERDPLARSDSCDIERRLQWLADTPKGSAARLHKVSEQLRKLLPKTHKGAHDTVLTHGQLLAAAYPERVAQNTGEGRFRLRNGRAARMPAHDALANEPFIVVAALDAGQRDGRIWLAARIGIDEIRAQFATAIASSRELQWDKQREALGAREVERLGALVLMQKPCAIQNTDEAATLLIEQIRQRGWSLFEKADALRALQAQLQLLHHHQAEQDWPASDDGALLANAENWLAPHLSAVRSLAQLRQVDIAQALRSALSWPQQQSIAKLLPSHFDTPAGTRRAISYPIDGEPYLAVPLQEMLGQTETPSLIDGRLPLTLHLLSPARRPLQITRDLVAFWQGSYPEVRKEMRGRYPKHHWPEDPMQASATRLGRAGKPGAASKPSK